MPLICEGKDMLGAFGAIAAVRSMTMWPHILVARLIPDCCSWDLSLEPFQERGGFLGVNDAFLGSHSIPLNFPSYTPLSPLRPTPALSSEFFHFSNTLFTRICGGQHVTIRMCPLSWPLNPNGNVHRVPIPDPTILV